LPIETVSQGMPGREGSRCLTRQEQVASYSRALVVTAATATMLKAAVLLHRMSLSRSRVFPGVCTKAHEGVFQGAPRGGAHTSPPRHSTNLEISVDINEAYTLLSLRACSKLHVKQLMLLVSPDPVLLNQWLEKWPGHFRLILRV